jgi:hypothetical protein
MTSTAIAAVALSDRARVALWQAIRYEDEGIGYALVEATDAASIEAVIERARTYLRLFIAADTGHLAVEDVPLVRGWGIAC